MRNVLKEMHKRELCRDFMFGSGRELRGKVNYVTVQKVYIVIPADPLLRLEIGGNIRVGSTELFHYVNKGPFGCTESTHSNSLTL